tara:strand:+ start:1142 stop:1360 length:219 start_codon:yes stop_codon:yes gene_type:complete
MTWKEEIKKEEEDYDYRRYNPTDSVESMAEEIQDLCENISIASEDSDALRRPKLLAYCIDKLSDILTRIKGY